MTYSMKLRDPRWQKKRLYILERDGWKCQCCESTEKNLQVHHLIYRKIDPWDYPDEAYQTLCEDCHQERQEIVDSLVEKMRLSLRNVRTEDLPSFILGFRNGAKVHAETPFRQHMHSTLEDALDITYDDEGGFLESGLFTDAIMELCYLQMFGKDATPEQREQKAVVLDMVSDKCGGGK